METETAQLDRIPRKEYHEQVDPIDGYDDLGDDQKKCRECKRPYPDYHVEDHCPGCRWSAKRALDERKTFTVGDRTELTFRPRPFDRGSNMFPMDKMRIKRRTDNAVFPQEPHKMHFESFDFAYITVRSVGKAGLGGRDGVNSSNGLIRKSSITGPMLQDIAILSFNGGATESEIVENCPYEHAVIGYYSLNVEDRFAFGGTDKYGHPTGYPLEEIVMFDEYIDRKEVATFDPEDGPVDRWDKSFD